jgi:hypothetical protein
MIRILLASMWIASPAFSASPSTSSPTSAHRELRLGILAHIDGNDRSALKHFAKCRALAVPVSPDADSCTIYEQMFGRERAKGDGASKPEARSIYRAGVAAYKRGDLVAADKAWHDCLDLSEVATAVRNDCLAAIDLIPGKLPESAEAPSRAEYMDGLTFYSQGLFEKAAASWTHCARMAPRGSGTEQDCEAGLEKLKTPSGSSDK